MTDTPAVHAALNAEIEPSGDLCIRTMAMPADTNANGDIFGGWLLSQMDIAGGVAASKIAKTRTVTVSGQGTARVVPDCAVVNVAAVYRARSVEEAFAGVNSAVEAIGARARTFVDP